MEDLKIYKVLALPKVLVPNAIYLVPEKKSQTLQIMVANKDGTGVLANINEAHIRSIIKEEEFFYTFNQSSKKNYSIFLLVLLLIMGLIWYWFSLPQLPAYQLKVMPFVHNISGSGVVEKASLVNIVSGIDGVVKTVQVKPGDAINPTDILLEFESNEIDEQLNAIDIKLNTLIERKQQQAQLEHQLAKLQLKQAEAELQRRKITILPKKEQEKFKDSELTLREGLIVSKEEQESFEAAKQIAEKNAQIKQLKLNEKFKNLEDIEDLRLMLELAKLKNQAANRIVRAKVSGTVLATHVQPNDVVEAGKHLFMLESNHPSEIKIQLDEKYLSQLYLNQQGTVSVNSHPDQNLSATINYIAPDILPSGKIEVGLRLDNPSGFLRKNMKVSFNIAAARIPQALVIPNDAIGIKKDQTNVIVVRRGKVHKKSIVLGLQGEVLSEVNSGLEKDDLVLLNTTIPLKENQRIRIIKQEYPEWITRIFKLIKPIDILSPFHQWKNDLIFADSLDWSSLNTRTSSLDEIYRFKEAF